MSDLAITPPEGTEVAHRDPVLALVASIRTDEAREQINAALPESVSLARFERATVTAIMTNPDLASVDRNSLFQSLVKCAMDGLLPDAREAALVIYNDTKANCKKAQYLPMVGGLRKTAAEFGWAIVARVVHANDKFSFTEEPPTITHQPVPPGVEAGAMSAAYAVATHKDGRRMQRVLYAPEIMKRKAKAKTQAIWNEWPMQMTEKTLVHDIFDEIPFGEREADRERIQRMLAAMRDDPRESLGALYGRDAAGELQAPVDADVVPDESPGVGAVVPPAASAAEAEDGGAGEPLTPGSEALPSSDPPAPPAEPEPEPEPTLPDEPVIEEAEIVEDDLTLDEREQQLLPGALAVKIPLGSYQDRSLEKILGYGADGVKWIGWALRVSWSAHDEVFKQALQLVAKAHTPDVYREWRKEQV